MHGVAFRSKVVCTTLVYGRESAARRVLAVTSGEGEIVERGLLSMSDEKWEEALARGART